MYGEDSVEKEIVRTVLCIVAGLWALFMCGSFQYGVMESMSGHNKGPLRRVEFLIPGYRIGHWLGSPVHKLEIPGSKP